MECKEWKRKAGTEGSLLYSRLWTEGTPKAVVMIAHGMAEHSARYEAFAAFLTAHGYALAMNDHRGHGKSLGDSGVKGHFADADGWHCVVEDLHLLRLELEKDFPGLPLFLMGHSMGSLLSRSYLTKHQGLTGCILCGTIGVNPAVGLGLALSSLQMKVKGPKSPGKLLDRLTGMGNCKRIQNPVNQFAWLSSLEEVCTQYEKDGDCGFPFTAAGYHDLFTGLKEVTGTAWAEQVPQALPLFVIAGDQDPVGAYGEGPAQVASWLKETGHSRTTLRLYPQARHEILNEACKEQVYRDVLGWLEEICSA